MVTVLEPAAIVCGSTALMLGVAIDSTTVLPQPRKKKQVVMLRVATIAFNIFKTHL